MQKILVKKPDGVRTNRNISFEVKELDCCAEEILEKIQIIYNAKPKTFFLNNGIVALYFADLFGNDNTISNIDKFQFLENTILENYVVRGDVVFIGCVPIGEESTSRYRGLTEEQIRYLLDNYSIDFYRNRNIATIRVARSLAEDF